MKIVINDCYGGFNLSDEACERLLELGMKLTEYSKDGRGYKDENADMVRKSGKYKLGGKYYLIHEEDIKFRTDPRVIQVIEELGSKADGFCSELKIIEVPDNIDIEIEEYDGLESVDEKHRTWR